MSHGGASPGPGVGLVLSARKEWVSQVSWTLPKAALGCLSPAPPGPWHVCSAAKPWQERP